jgi:4'-phosphopantetheinyl transferase
VTPTRLALDRWEPLPAAPDLPPRTVDVCAADLDALDPSLVAPLSDHERARTERLLRERDARRWTRARGLLRTLLGRYLAAEPAVIAIAATQRGKPTVAGNVHFNLSRSGAVVVCAFAREREVGIDVEARERPRRELEIARRAFPEELDRLASLTGRERREEFLRLWARHEAAVKCRGTGLAEPPSEVDRARLWIDDLDLGPGIACALAVDGGPPEPLRLWAIAAV